MVEYFPNLRTPHACGVLISEDPITNYTALDFPPMDFSCAQFDMYVAEDVKFEKFDILGQRGPGAIKDCLQIIEQNRGEKVDISNPDKFFTDPCISQQLKSSRTIGCFYIESPAMRQLITKLRCDNYLTLVAASSVIRPGVGSSGMMDVYIKRHRDAKSTVYLHPVMEEQLAETYGVMVYQEDVIKVGLFFGGLDLADADVLRRIMSGKHRSVSHLQEIESKFFKNCEELGRPAETAKEVWRQMESFAGYTFSKAHSASFAVESYQSLYLKTYYPLEFMTATINNHGGFYSPQIYINEAKKDGAIIHNPCVNMSYWTTTIYGIDIYLCFDLVKDLEVRTVKQLLNERQINGKYNSLENFIMRTGVSETQISILIRIGSLSFTNTVKTNMQWESLYICSEIKDRSLPIGLFDEAVKVPEIPKFDYSLVEHLYDEIRYFKFPVTETWFSLIRSTFHGVYANDMDKHVGKTVRMVGDFVTYKPVRTK